MKVNDDRTPEQRETHRCLVIGTDSFLSGWGGAEGGVSYAAWACRSEDMRDVLTWVERRGDMKRVRVTYGSWKPSARGHAHIYVVGPNHPSVARKNEFKAWKERQSARVQFEPEALAMLEA